MPAAEPKTTVEIPLDEMSPEQKMTAGHQLIAKAKSADLQYMDDALRRAEATHAVLTRDREALAKYGHQLHPETQIMLDDSLVMVKALQMGVEALTALTLNNGGLPPRPRVKRTAAPRR